MFRRATAIGSAVLIGMVGMLSAGGAARADSSAAAPVILVDPGQQVRPVSKLLYGANHRYGYDGFGSFDPQTGEVYPKLTDEARGAGISVIRYPGGTIANTFHWERAVGSEAQRGCQTHGGTGEPLDSDYGPDEQARFAEQVGASDDFVANFATGTPQEAADWVEYMNAPVGTNPNGGTAWAAVRAANGHPAPYHVRWWEVGNEMQGNGQRYWMGTEPAAQAAQKYAFGGSTVFTGQPMGSACDHRASASSSTGAPNQSFFAYYPPVAPDSQTVDVAGEAWREVSDLSTAGPDDHVYTLDSSTGRVTFGDGGHGAIPPEGAQITISYTSGPHQGFVDFYRAMKNADPNIKVCAGFTSSDFIQAMGATHPYDCLQVHPYISFSATTPDATAAHDTAITRADGFAGTVSSWQQQLAAASGAPTVALTEYGMLGGGFQGSDAYLRSLDQGLIGAVDLENWIKLGVPIAEKHSLVDFQPGFAPPGAVSLIGIDQSMFGWAPSFVPAAAADVVNLFSHMTGSSVVSNDIADNPVRNGYAGDYPALQAVTTVDDTGHLYLTVVNRDPARDITTQVLARRFLYRDTASVWTVDGPSTASSNDPDHPNVVTLAKSSLSLPSGGFRYTFPAHSVTAIELSRAATVQTSTELATPSTPEPVAPGGTVDADVTLTNTSTTSQAAGTLTTFAPAGWGTSLSTNDYALQPGQATATRVSINVPPGTPDGSYQVVVAAHQRGVVSAWAVIHLTVRTGGN